MKTISRFFSLFPATPIGKAVDVSVTFLALVVFLLTSATAWAQVTPLGYWRFENPNPLADQSGNGHTITVNPGLVDLRTVSPMVGQYHHGSAVPGAPGVTAALDAGSANQELTLEIWLRFTPGHRSGSVHWPNKCQLSFYDNRLEWWVRTAGNTTQVLAIPLNGVGMSDPDYLYDSTWHHVVAQYSSCTGDQRVFVDGLCPQGWSRHVTNAPAVRDGGVFHFTYEGQLDKLIGDVDEVAVYDVLIPPLLVYQHYQQGLAGQPYTFTPTFAGPLPMPPITQQGGYNLLEFAPEYPSVPKTPLQLFSQYPLPRYSTTDSIRPIAPWIADHQPFFYGTVPAVSNAEARRMLDTLAIDWNYYLYCGIAKLGYDYTMPFRIGNPTYYAYHALASMNDPATDHLPRFTSTNWRHVNVKDLLPNRAPGNQVLRQSLPDTFYIRDSLGQPALDGFNFRRFNFASAASPTDYRLDSLTLDGLVNEYYLDSFLSLATVRFMDMIGENDETVGILNQAFVHQDSEVIADFALFTPQVSTVYRGERVNTFRERYQAPWRSHIDSLNAAAGRDSLETLWYNLAGESGAYSRTRKVLQFRGGGKRPSPFNYPQVPGNWRHGAGAAFGIDQMLGNLYHQTSAGDSLFMPCLSPGFNDGGQYSVDDVDMIRPGQFLGLLKAMTCLGADSYAAWMLQFGNPQIQANWRAWQLPMYSYAQGVTSRVQEFLYNGTVLVGDTALTYFGVPPTYFNFSSGNGQDFITARKLHGQPLYLISVTAQRTNNAPGQGNHRRPVSFALRDNNGNVVYAPLRLETRLQGSMYLLDNTLPGSPVMVQLDRWHEWKEPSHWCRDFDFEAEVWDSASVAVVVGTERPVGVAPGDFLKFTSYVEVADTHQSLHYHFKPRGADQDSLYLWLHVRGGSNGGAVRARIDGGAWQRIPVSPGTAWLWAGRDVSNQPVRFSVLNTDWHEIEVGVSDAGIEVDQVTLKRSPADFSGQAFTVVAMGHDTCLGMPVQFTGAVGQPAGCVDVEWDFGDGGRSYEMSPSHVFQYPGTYSVVFSAWHGCLDSTVSDTVVVEIHAPYVDAGPDQIVCFGGTDTLAGVVFGTNPHVWSVRPPLNILTLTDTTVLDPLVQPTVSGYYYLRADSGGCTMRDSAWVAVVGPLSPVAPADDSLCAGQQDSIKVLGGYYVWWDPDSTLSDSVGWAVVASPTVTTTYHWYASDVCRCDTVDGYVTITIRTLDAILTPDTSLCAGGSVRLDAVPGMAGYLWSPGATLTNPVDPSPYASPTTSTDYALQVTEAGGCVFRDTVRVTVGGLPVAISGLDSICHGMRDTLSVTSVPGGSYAWGPSLWVQSTWGDSADFRPNYSGWATVTVTDSLGCTASDSLFIAVDSLTLGFGIVPGDTVACHGASLNFGTTNAADFYSWSTFDVSPMISYTFYATTEIWVQAQDVWGGAGCRAADTITVIVDSLALMAGILTPDTAVCLGDSFALQLNAAALVPGATYLWVPSAGLSSATVAGPVASPLVTTQYVLTVTDSNGCVAVDSVLVTVDPAGPFADILDADTVVCDGTTLTLDAAPVPGGFYSWQPMGGIGLSVTVAPTVTTDYVLTVTDGGACFGRDTVRVEVRSCCLVPGVPTLIRPVASTWPLPTTGGAVHIVDTFWVDQGISFTGVTFWMDAGAAVVVLPGVALTCSTCTLQAACPEVWAGVRLQAGSGGFTGFRTTIRQADVGVWSKAGAAYTLDRCRFQENWIGVLADTLLTGTHPGVIRGSTFGGGGLLAPYAGYAAGFAGVYARDVRGGFELGAVGAANQNLLQGLQNGFYSYRSTATVRNCLFRDMVHVGPLGAISACGVRAIKPPDGDPFVPTIHVGHPTSASLNDLYQHRNVFNNCRFGVMVDSTHHVAVRGNTIRGGTQAGVWVRKQSPLGTLAVERDSILNTSLGIQLNEIRGVPGAVLRGNVIEGNNAVVRRGIRLGSVWYAGLGNFATGLLVEDNTVALRGDGIWAEGCDHVAIDGNSVYAGASPQPWSNRGIFLGGCVDMRVFDNEIFSNRGGALADTSFVGFMGSLSPETDLRCNLIHDVGRCVVWEGNCGASRMYRNSLGRAVDGLVLKDLAVIGPQGSGPPPANAPKETQGNTWGVNQHLRWQVLVAGDNTNGANSVFFLKPGAANNPNPARCGTMGQFVTGFTKSVLTGNVQIPLCVANLPGGSNGGNITQIANRQLNGSGASFRENAWAWTEVQQDNALLGYDPVIPPYHAGVGPLAPGRLAHAELRLRLAQVQASLALASGTVASTPEELTEKQMKLILAAAMMPGFDSLSVMDRNGLELLAELCPSVDGRGAFLARALLSREGTMEWHYDDCPGSAAKMVGEAVQGSGSVIPSIWPNPSDKSVNVQLPLGSSATFDVEVVNLFGQRLTHAEGSGGETLTLSTVDLPAATYLVRVSGGGGSWQFRLVVVH